MSSRHQPEGDQGDLLALRKPELADAKNDRDHRRAGEARRLLPLLTSCRIAFEQWDPIPLIHLRADRIDAGKGGSHV